jgi:hypothetical protein
VRRGRGGVRHCRAGAAHPEFRRLRGQVAASLAALRVLNLSSNALRGALPAGLLQWPSLILSLSDAAAASTSSSSSHDDCDCEEPGFPADHRPRHEIRRAGAKRGAVRERLPQPKIQVRRHRGCVGTEDRRTIIIT